MAIEASRLQVADLVIGQTQFQPDEFDCAVSEAVAYASSVVEATLHGVQALGGHGFIRRHEWSSGTVQIHRLVVVRSLLGRLAG